MGTRAQRRTALHRRAAVFAGGTDDAVHIVDDATRGLYGSGDVVEQYYCRFGLNEEHLPALRAPGSRSRGSTVPITPPASCDSPHIVLLLTLFVPQASSTAENRIRS